MSLVDYLVSSVTCNIWHIVERDAISQYIGLNEVLNGQKSKPKPESIVNSSKCFTNLIISSF